MEKPGMEKAGHFRIDEKSFLDAVGAMPAVKIHSRDSSGALSPPAKESPSPEEEPPPLRERTSAPDIRKAFTEQDIEEYIGAHLNNFLSSGRNPLHIDSEAYRLLADFVWIVRRKDLSISGMASRIIIDHFKEKGCLIEKIKEFYKKQLD